MDSKIFGEDLVHAEQETMSLSHPEAGYELATNWGLPPEIAEVIRFHHSPEFSKAFPVNVGIVSLAETWIRRIALGNADKGDLIRESTTLLTTIGMNASTASGAFDEVAKLEFVHFEWDGS